MVDRPTVNGRQSHGTWSTVARYAVDGPTVNCAVQQILPVASPGATPTFSPVFETRKKAGNGGIWKHPPPPPPPPLLLLAPPVRPPLSPPLLLTRMHYCFAFAGRVGSAAAGGRGAQQRQQHQQQQPTNAELLKQSQSYALLSSDEEDGGGGGGYSSLKVLFLRETSSFSSREICTPRTNARRTHLPTCCTMCACRLTCRGGQFC